MAKSRDAFRTISEVAEWLDTPAHVLRFWESKFTQVKPVKRAGGRRYYRPDDMMLLSGIKALLHDQGLTIKGAQKLLREKGVKHVAGLGQDPDAMLDDMTDVIDGTASEIAVAPEVKSAGLSDNAKPSAPKLTVNFGAPKPVAPAPQSNAVLGDAALIRDAASGGEAAPIREAASGDDALNDASLDVETGEIVPFSTQIALDSSRRSGRIPAIPTNPGAFARPGVLSAILKSRPADLTAKAAALAPIATRLRTQAAAMKSPSR